MSGAPESDGAPVLEIRDLRFSRGPEPADFRLHLPHLSLARGAFLAIAGESGSGKSTLLDLIGLIAVPERVGAFRLAGREVGPELCRGDLEAVAGLRRRALGYILQQGGLLPFLDVARNIEITAPPGGAPFETVDLAERLGIAGVLSRKPDALSIGQRQRVAIARAIMGDPAVILADEPTAALDPPTARATLALLAQIAAERGTAVVMASHSWALIREFSLPVLAARITEDRDAPSVSFEPGLARGMAA